MQLLSQLSLVPLAELGPAMRGRVGTCPMLHAFLPLPIVLPSICPPENPVAMPFVVVVLSLICTAIGPCEDSVAMHAILLPNSLIPIAIFPSESACAAHFVLREFTIVG